MMVPPFAHNPTEGLPPGPGFAMISAGAEIMTVPLLCAFTAADEPPLVVIIEAAEIVMDPPVCAVTPKDGIPLFMMVKGFMITMDPTSDPTSFATTACAVTPLVVKLRSPLDVMVPPLAHSA
jgi:hypothetical protein